MPLNDVHAEGSGRGQELVAAGHRAGHIALGLLRQLPHRGTDDLHRRHGDSCRAPAEAVMPAGVQLDQVICRER